jgi:hypothetical protein
VTGITYGGNISAAGAGPCTNDRRAATGFLSATDLHITASSPARDQSRGAAHPAMDIDGEMRDSTPDAGADDHAEPEGRLEHRRHLTGRPGHGLDAVVRAVADRPGGAEISVRSRETDSAPCARQVRKFRGVPRLSRGRRAAMVAACGSSW